MVQMKVECNSFLNIYKLIWLIDEKWTEVYLCFEKVRKKKIKVNEKDVLQQEKLKAKCKSQEKMDKYLQSFSHFPNEYDIEGVQIMAVEGVQQWL